MSYDKTALINRYRWYELVGIYAGIAVFLTFVLAPFVEGFLVSLKPLSQLFSSPYRFFPENGSFDAYITMWDSVPGFARTLWVNLAIALALDNNAHRQCFPYHEGPRLKS